ncbi:MULTISPECIES: hypothetical protein [Pseudomonas]|uniref:hypothetical protein n=1 Tax=Pseudomonas TaxID=286 RepID=UPI001AE73604|nr:MULTISPECIES: hypothetical protein [unclassified Pseudomonas]MBP1126812.1 chromosome segregation ATPase [Pseudomonas sp. PvP025]MDQ0400672.1 chromosome segregation ATPase [Pseudomonas sp. PvP006]
MITFKHSFGLAAILALAGCATPPGSCDAGNRDSSMLTKMNCDYSGGYSDQVKQKEAALTASREENAMFHQVYENIAAQQANTRRDLATQQQSQAQLNQSLAQLLGTLKKRRANQGDVQKQVASLEQQLKANQAQASGGSATPQQLAAKQEQLKTLQKKVNQLQFSLGYEE